MAWTRAIDVDAKNGRWLWTAVVVLLAAASGAQAVTQAVALAKTGSSAGQYFPSSGQFLLNALPLCLLALAATMPLALRRPLLAAVMSAAAVLVTQAGFHRATVAGVLALLIAAFRLGTAEPAAPAVRQTGEAVALTGDTGGAHGRLSGAWREFAALALGLPFLLLALASRDTAPVLLAAGLPLAAGAGIAVKASRSASGAHEARTVLTDTLTEHLARGERARIARELHDVVAHHISMIAVRAETARLTTPGMPEVGAARLREIGDTARAGLTEMRRLLGVLREDVAEQEVGERQPQPGLPQVSSLVDAAREAAGGSMRLIVSGPVASFDPGVELVAYRIVQEALTNARRHAAGAAVDVELRYETDVLRLRVRDNGPGPASAPGGEPPAGHGLLGMRERAATVGGTMAAGPAPGGGFQVEATLPLGQA